MGATGTATFRDTFAPTAKAMLSDVALVERANADDARRIVHDIWTNQSMEEVWRELRRKSKADPGAFHFPARALSAGQHARWFPAERQAAGICYFAEQAAWTALQGWPTETDAEMVHERGTMDAPEYLLRVQRHRTERYRRGLVVAVTGCACMVFGSPLHGTVAKIVGVALAKNVTGKVVRELVRGLSFDFRCEA